MTNNVVGLYAAELFNRKLQLRYHLSFLIPQFCDSMMMHVNDHRAVRKCYYGLIPEQIESYFVKMSEHYVEMRALCTYVITILQTKH